MASSAARALGAGAFHSIEGYCACTTAAPGSVLNVEVYDSTVAAGRFCGWAVPATNTVSALADGDTRPGRAMVAASRAAVVILVAFMVVVLLV
jgi:hypothetical protein